MSKRSEVSRRDILEASERIAGHVRRTPLLDLGDPLDLGFKLSLKLDNLQPTGSFKARGAFAVLTAATVPTAGVAAASGGNFGLAIAHAAEELGHRATIFVPGNSPDEKIERIRDSGADVRVVPGYYDQALAKCEEWVADKEVFVAHAYDQPEVVAGQGTSGKEIMEQESGTDAVVVAVGGGGLIAGVASWVRDEVAVVAVEPETCRSFNAALQAGHQVRVGNSGIASSSLSTEVIGDHAWAARGWIDQSVLVSDDAISEAQSWLWSEVRLAVEPAAAATVAALATGAFQPTPGSRVVAIISGANVDPATVV